LIVGPDLITGPQAFAIAHNEGMNLPSWPCYLNGCFTTLDQARISPLDRGFIFGDGIYEVITVYGGQAFRFADHMTRLERSLGEVRMRNPYARGQWLQIATDLVAQYADSMRANTPKGTEIPNNWLIYLQVTRGVALRDHVMPLGLEPTVFMMCSPLKGASSEQREQGVRCISAEDFRWKMGHIKSTSLLAAVLARQMSADVDAVETVMFRDGFLSEASTCNVWVVKDGSVIGTPKDQLVLEGIRYGVIEEICQSQGIPFELRRTSRDEVLAADELLLSSASKEVLPITQLDNQAIGSGRPGPVYGRLYAAYQAAKIAP
jgi:D-alanine transaminase